MPTVYQVGEEAPVALAKGVAAMLEKRPQSLKARLGTIAPRTLEGVQSRLMGLAGESIVQVNWLQPFADSLMAIFYKITHEEPDWELIPGGGEYDALLPILQRALAMHAAGDIAFCAIKFDCGCGAGEVFICRKLVENSVLTLLSAWLVMRQTGACCIRFRLASAPACRDRRSAANPRNRRHPQTDPRSHPRGAPHCHRLVFL